MARPFNTKNMFKMQRDDNGLFVRSKSFSSGRTNTGAMNKLERSNMEWDGSFENVTTKDVEKVMMTIQEPFKVRESLTSDELISLSTVFVDQLRNVPLPLELSIPDAIDLSLEPKKTLQKSIQQRIHSILDSLVHITDSQGKSLVRVFGGLCGHDVNILRPMFEKNYNNVKEAIDDFDSILEQNAQEATPRDPLLYKTRLRLREHFFQALEKDFVEERENLNEWKKQSNKNQKQLEENEANVLTRSKRKRRTEKRDDFVYEFDNEIVEPERKSISSRRKNKKIAINDVLRDDERGKRGR